MANLGETFSAADMPQGNGGDFAPLPAGWYTVRISESGIQTTKAGTGQYIKNRLDVIGPTHAGRVLFANLNIRNPNPKAEEIGRQQLGDILRAIGKASIQDTDELIGATLQVKVAVKNDEQYGETNEVKAYRAVEGSAPPMPAAAPAAAPVAAGKAPPWARK
jgi:hypothetical protein